VTRRERLERKAERREEWADKASARAAGRFDTARDTADRIPMGQPILVGHHSEKRHRRDAERIDNNMRKGVEEQNKAARHRGKADGLRRQLESNIFSDDHDAIEALEKRIAEREEYAERVKLVNKAYRKAKGDVEKMVELGVSRKLAEQAAKTMKLCPWLKKPLDTTNLRAAIRRDKKRILEVQARQARAEAAEEAGGVTIEPWGESYVRVTFAEKPDRSVLKALKAAGFRWGGGSWSGLRESLPEEVEELRDEE